MTESKDHKHEHGHAHSHEDAAGDHEHKDNHGPHEFPALIGFMRESSCWQRI